MHKIIQSAHKALKSEIDGLQNLKQSLAEDFTKAVLMMAAAKGKIVVTGIGKSGHVGHKIAATLASTGTPSFFVHPSEASHGDLGMIAANDAVLALSNSGDTGELFNIIAYCKRFSIPLIGITKNEQSELGRNADICLKLPKFTEACPLQLAPTTSTTIQMALGDALAIALLENKGFKAEDFSVFHPGGALGSQLICVDEIMHKDCPTVEKSQNLRDVILQIAGGKLGSVAVTDKDNHILGIITDGDLRRHINDDLTEQTAQDIMTQNPICISPNMLASEALAIMNKKNITVLLVAEQKKLVGGLHIHDLLRRGVK